MRLLRKYTEYSYLKGDFVYYWENGELKRSKCVCANEHIILIEDGEDVSVMGYLWILNSRNAEL